MKILKFIVLLIAFCLSATAQAGQSVAGMLNDFAWEKRQILLFAPDTQDKKYQAFIAAQQRQLSGFEDRRLQVWHLIAGQPVILGEDEKHNGVSVEDFQTVYAIAADEFRVILIGYDQGEKLRQDTVDVERIFAAIDQMPMRVQEMQQENKQ
ncbi:MAG: DUF4174 domain-containing protein [Thiolinea sp.]